MKARGLHNLMQRRQQYRCPGRAPRVRMSPRPPPLPRVRVRQLQVRHEYRPPLRIVYRRNKELELLHIKIERIAKELDRQLKRAKRRHRNVFEPEDFFHPYWIRNDPVDPPTPTQGRLRSTEWSVTFDYGATATSTTDVTVGSANSWGYASN